MIFLLGLLAAGVSAAGCVAPARNARQINLVRNALPHQAAAHSLDSDSRVVHFVQQPPPMPAPPRELRARRPAREAIWIEGYYAYGDRGKAYHWVPGHWEIPPDRQRTYVRPSWEPRENGYVYVRGYWR